MAQLFCCRENANTYPGVTVWGNIFTLIKYEISDYATYKGITATKLSTVNS